MIIITMRGIYAITFVLLISSCVSAWELPNLPSGKRTQYFLLHDDGGYKYGYDTGNDHFAKQAGDAHNEVAGHYVYQDANGRAVDVKYTAGINGFIPEGLENLRSQAQAPSAPSQDYIYPPPTVYHSPDAVEEEQSKNRDASYNLNIDTESYKRHETSDPAGNIYGRYSYSNDAGTHDLSYVAGTNTGFVATSGSLAQPNGLLGGKNLEYIIPRYANGVSSLRKPVHQDADGSYSFGFSTDDQTRQENSDTNGNVQGRYSYTNEAGTHDLSYVAGSETGFLPIGGSLALANGLTDKYVPSSIGYASSSGSYSDSYPASVSNADGSYSFEYSTGDSSRQESSDSNGNVHGRYYYTNQAGDHDLSYIAGPEIGFQPTSGSLATPNGLATKTGSQAYQELPQVKYTYIPPTTTDSSETTVDSNDDQANTGDASYNFSIDTDEYKRVETADAEGNVRGSYSYKNEAGTHDLSYVAGSNTGFVATGGSLALPNGLEGKDDPTIHYYTTMPPETYLPPIAAPLQAPADLKLNPVDGSYSFSIDTDEYKRKEVSDALGNIEGRFSYINNKGSHDLSYIAGSKTGFALTGGSLAVPNGITGGKFAGPFASPQYLPPLTGINSAKANNLVLKQYYPSKSQSKYGYIYELS